MFFLEALAEMKQGKPMCRTSWLRTDGYVVVMPGMKTVWKILIVPNANAGNHLFTVADFEGDDWTLYRADDWADDVVAPV